MDRQETAQWAADLLIRYYDNDIQPFLDACHEDVLWIGPAEKQVIRTRKALCEAFAAEKHQLRFAVHDLVVLPIPTGSQRVCEIMMRFFVDTFWPDGSVDRIFQRIQFTCVWERGERKIRLCHISDAIRYDERDHIYPVHYRSKYSGVVLAGEERTFRVCLKGVDRSVFYLRPEGILYAETVGRHTLVHTKDQNLEVLESVSSLEQRCAQRLVRIHTSYLVNPKFVQSVSRFQVTLENGVTLPIPEKRYTEVKARLLQE